MDESSWKKNIISVFILFFFCRLSCYHYKTPQLATIQRVPALCVFWDLEKTVLHKTRVSGTVLWSPTNANSPIYMYISQKPW